MTTNTYAPSLATLAKISTAQYVDACGSLVTPTLQGLIDTEDAHYPDWRSEGYTWAEVKAALIDAWNARN